MDSRTNARAAALILKLRRQNRLLEKDVQKKHDAMWLYKISALAHQMGNLEKAEEAYNLGGTVEVEHEQSIAQDRSGKPDTR